LEGPALEKYPLLRILQEFMRKHGALVTLMSGSGSTTFAIVATQVAAEELAAGVRARFGDHCWVSTIPLE
jgi:4-diphosphocytidyl-2C-methyl-D-erythritol kinase